MKIKIDPTRAVWYQIRKECFNPSDRAYKYFGAKGIIVCERWHNSFENFLLDMGEKPQDKCLMRIDCKKNFFKDNCVWSTRKEKRRNDEGKRRVKYIEAFGKRMLATDWEKEIGIKAGTIYSRVTNYKLTSEESLKVRYKKDRKNSRILEYLGKSMTIADWSRETGILDNTIRSRLSYGWTVEKTLTSIKKKRSQV